MVLTLVSNLIYLLLGFVAGYFVQKDRLQQTISDTVKKIDIKMSPVGIVRRPTAQELYKRTNPLQKKIEEGNKEMAKTLENIKELK